METSTDFPPTWAGRRPDLKDPSASAYDMALANMFVGAGWTDQEAVDAMIAWRREHGHSPKLRDDYYLRTLAKARVNYGGFETNGSSEQHSSQVELPTIRVDVDQHRVVDETVAALRADNSLYQRANVLVRVLYDDDQADRISRPQGSPRIAPVPIANLQDRITRCAQFRRKNLVHPPAWVASQVHARGGWPGIPYLVGLSDAPVLRPNGSLWQQAGYDAVTRTLYVPSGDFPEVPARPTNADVQGAVAALLEIVCDFPFATEAHQSAWLAALLTPLARRAFDGPVPIFLVEANRPGAGKSLLVQVIGRIVLNRHLPVSKYVHDDEEMRKRITATAIAGDQMFLLDNIRGSFGLPAIDSAATSTVWCDRILGHSERVHLPFSTVMYATGNGVRIARDTLRRVIPIRLDVEVESPEERSGFRHPDLLNWVSKERPRLLAAALTILSSSLLRSDRLSGLPPFGSFESWAVVREAIVRAGMPDPYQARAFLDTHLESDADAALALVRAWRQYVAHGDEVLVASLVSTLYPAESAPPSDEQSRAMRSALEAFAGSPDGKFRRRIGNKLRGLRGKLIDGSMLVSESQHTREGTAWRLISSSGCV